MKSVSNGVWGNPHQAQAGARQSLRLLSFGSKRPCLLLLRHVENGYKEVTTYKNSGNLYAIFMGYKYIHMCMYID